MQMLVLHGFMMMFVIIAVLAMNMDMCMGVRMLMGVDGISVGMFVGVRVCMLMGMLQPNGILDHKISADHHYNQGNIELDCGSFPQKQHTKNHAQKRCNGVVGTCLRRSQILLRHDIEIDAESIGNKAKQQYTNHPNNRRYALTDYPGNNQASESGESAFDHYDLNRTLVADHSGAVVFNAPAQTRTEHEQRTDVELK